MGNTLVYQLFHPWHWLTYGQNSAVVGLIVVVAYTIYTRRMMLLAQQTRRGELYPLVVLQGTSLNKGVLEVRLVNVGNGVLLNAFQWRQQVSESFELGQTFLERPLRVEKQFVGTLMSQATLTVNIEVSGSEQQSLYVVEGTDSFGGRHQFCMLRQMDGPDTYNYAVRMTHPSDLLPLWRRMYWKLFEWRARFRTRLTRF